MSKKQTVRQAYGYHKRRAKIHHIRWRFTFQDWVACWEASLGPNWFEMRGCIAGKFVMARNGDKGPYSRTNVHIVTCETNHKETIANGTSNHGEKNGRAKLTAKQVKTIFLAEGTQADIAKRFNTTQERVCRIKLRQCWRRVTEGL